MSPEIPIPKYAVATVWPDDHLSWVIRLRNPFVAALVKPVALTGLHLHCWPSGVEKEISSRKLVRIIGDMAAIWGEDVEHLSGLPSAWSFSFDEKFQPPKYLLIDAPEPQEWTGILEPERRILWSVADVDGATALAWIRDFGGEPKFPDDTRAVENYYREFCQREESLPPEDR